MNKTSKESVKQQALPLKTIFKTWLPLAASWMLMSLEMPTINAIVARLPNAEVNLAAYGGVSFPIALTIEAPVIMLLAASTALSKDWASYRKLRRFAVWLGGILTALHLIVVLTPLYGFLVGTVLQVPEEVVQPAWWGLLFLTPWTFAIAYRRFQHGAMIRFDHAGVVGKTTLVRLITVAVVLTSGFLIGSIPGTILAGFAQGLGVTVEAVYAGLMVRKIHQEIKDAPAVESPLTLKRFAAFYVPLALTSTLWLLWQPLISGAVSRMPDSLESLAVWSVTSGLMFVLRSAGMAFNEVVVALLDRPAAYRTLRKFAILIAMSVTGLAVVFILTPLSSLWFGVVANLSAEKVALARWALVFGIPLGGLSIFISFFQGTIVQKKRTRAIPEAVVLFLIGMLLVLGAGIITQDFKGVYVASVSFTFAHLMQLIWLWIRSRKQRQALTGRTE